MSKRPVVFLVLLLPVTVASIGCSFPFALERSLRYPETRATNPAAGRVDPTSPLKSAGRASISTPFGIVRPGDTRVRAVPHHIEVSFTGTCNSDVSA